MTEDQNKIDLHEDYEPVAERRPVPVLLIAFLVALLFWADLYVLQNGGDVAGSKGAFPAMVYFPFKSYAEVKIANPGSNDPREKGMEVYKLCAQCHQATGLGVAGQFPPLAGSEWLNTESAEKAIRIVLNGLNGPIEVQGKQFNNSMVPWRDILSDEQIANVLTYVRSEWGNKASPVKPEQVKQVRDGTASRAIPWTAPELQQLP
jgi:mono/diheme cytochrome c family protein